MKKYSALLITLAFFFNAAAGLCRRMPETIIRVGLLKQVAGCNISCDGAYYLYELANGTQTPVKPLDDYPVKADDSSVIINGKRYASPLRLVAQGEGSVVRVNGRRFRDNIMLIARGGKLTVVNELGIEGYIYGILTREASPKWPLETLKAQAVVSRTYVLRNLRKHERDGFDVCTETHCQVYGGMEAEDPICTKAVDETAGEVLTWNGELAQTLFHASCGGYTENPNNVWSWESETPPYLKGCKDKYCRNSPHNTWSSTIKAETIRQRLRKAGHEVGVIKKIKMSGEYKSGRTRNLVIKHSDGTLTLTAARFRMAVDTWLVKSAFLDDVSKKGDSFVFEGRGWGHGVGMCQWGAKMMGEDEKNYQEILEYYYPGAVVEKWEE